MDNEHSSIMQDWLLWLTMTSLGSILWVGVCAIPLVLVGDRDNFWTGIFWVTSQALAVGIAQGLVVRWRIRGAGAWILATVIGGPIGIWAGFALVDIVSFVDSHGTIVWVMLGITIGLAQWFVLRNRVRHAWCWAIANPIIWGVSSLIADAIFGPLSGVALITTLGLAEFARGLLLAWLLHEPVITNLGAQVTRPQPPLLPFS